MKPRTRELFTFLRARAADAVPSLRGVKLARCAEADRDHAASPRQFMHVGHRPKTVCYAGATEALAPQWKAGLIAHELGHLAAIGARKRHTEKDADRIGGVLTGLTVKRRGPCNLEWANGPSRPFRGAEPAHA